MESEGEIQGVPPDAVPFQGSDAVLVEQGIFDKVAADHMQAYSDDNDEFSQVVAVEPTDDGLPDNPEDDE